MTSEKFIAFMEKLLEKTKAGDIKWERYLTRNPSEAWACTTKSFSCIAGTMKVNMLSDEDADVIEFSIKYDDTLPISIWEIEGGRERQVALRLVNYVYNQFPNLEKSIDQFLSDS